MIWTLVFHHTAATTQEETTRRGRAHIQSFTSRVVTSCEEDQKLSPRFAPLYCVLTWENAC